MSDDSNSNPKASRVFKYAVYSGLAFASSVSLSLAGTQMVFAKPYAQKMGCLLVSLMPAVYWGFAVSKHSLKGLAQETIATSAFMMYCASILDGALSKKHMPFGLNPIGVGVLAHGVYDLLHYFNMLPYHDHVTTGYDLACAVADVPLGLFMCWFWR